MFKYLMAIILNDYYVSKYEGLGKTGGVNGASKRLQYLVKLKPLRTLTPRLLDRNRKFKYGDCDNYLSILKATAKSIARNANLVKINDAHIHTRGVSGWACPQGEYVDVPALLFDLNKTITDYSASWNKPADHYVEYVELNTNKLFDDLCFSLDNLYANCYK